MSPGHIGSQPKEIHVALFSLDHVDFSATFSAFLSLSRIILGPKKARRKNDKLNDNKCLQIDVSTTKSQVRARSSLLRLAQEERPVLSKSLDNARVGGVDPGCAQRLQLLLYLAKDV